MRPFTITVATDAAAAVQAASGASVQYLAGGTTLVDLMMMRPAQLVDITRIAAPELRAIELSPQGLYIGALATMRQVADLGSAFQAGGLISVTSL